MSFEALPPKLEQSVQLFAEQQHVSHDEAVLMLIETGLKIIDGPLLVERESNPAEQLIGLFSSPDDCVLMDEVISIVYEGRKAAAVRDIAI